MENGKIILGVNQRYLLTVREGWKSKCSFCFLVLREYISRCFELINFFREEKLLVKIRKEDCFMLGEVKKRVELMRIQVFGLWGFSDFILVVEWLYKVIVWDVTLQSERRFGLAIYWFGDKI